MHAATWTAPEQYRAVSTAARFEDWEFPYASVLGSAAAVEYAREVGMDAIALRTPQLAARLRSQLEAIPGIRVLDEGRELAALVTFEIPQWEATRFKNALDEEGVNSALSFREFAQFNFSDKEVDLCLRLSPHYYNTEEEVDHVADVVTRPAAHPIR